MCPPSHKRWLLQIGERLVNLPGLDLPSSCIADCPFPFLQCPTSAGSPAFCSAHGACLTPTGACLCHEGYSGPACERCTYGWFRTSAGLCSRNPEVDVTSTAQTITQARTGAGVLSAGLCFAASGKLRQ